MRELQLTNTLIGVEIVMLRRQPLLVDTGEAEPDRHLSGYWQVLRGYNETIVCKVCPG